MISKERLTVFINSLDRGNSPFLTELEQEALQTNVPVIRKEMQSLLKLLLAVRRPAHILEVGTAIGFSALLMKEYAPEGCVLTTIESDAARSFRAGENFRRAGREEEIRLLEGGAEDILPQLTGQFDFIFMDAAKGQYLSFLPEVMRLLGEGGLLLSDNVLQDGDVLESRFAVPRRNRTIHARMREYLYVLTHDERLQTAVLPVGDGAAVSVRLPRQP